MNPLETTNADLAIATIVKRMEFTSDLETGRCSLVLELLADDRCPALVVVVEAYGVAELKAEGLGGGVTQLLGLCARDVSKQQHDRVNFILEDLEDGRLFLKCQSLTTTRSSRSG